jgi:hypothetical protein
MIRCGMLTRCHLGVLGAGRLCQALRNQLPSLSVFSPTPLPRPGTNHPFASKSSTDTSIILVKDRHRIHCCPSDHSPPTPTFSHPSSLLVQPARQNRSRYLVILCCIRRRVSCHVEPRTHSDNLSSSEPDSEQLGLPSLYLPPSRFAPPMRSPPQAHRPADL